MSKIEYKVWWIPQVPGKPFEVKVESVDEGQKLCDVLAKYDSFQYENGVKPDYCNAGGVMFKHPEYTEGGWHVVPDDGWEWNDIMKEIAQMDGE